MYWVLARFACNTYVGSYQLEGYFRFSNHYHYVVQYILLLASLLEGAKNDQTELIKSILPIKFP
jgi:hypothetical protein